MMNINTKILFALTPLFIGIATEELPTDNSDLETSLSFEPKHLANDTILNNIKIVIDKLIETITLESSNEYNKRRFTKARKSLFSEFKAFLTDVRDLVDEISKTPEAKEAFQHAKEAGKQFFKDVEEGKAVDRIKKGFEIFKREKDKFNNVTRRNNENDTKEYVARMDRVLKKLNKCKEKKKILLKTFKEILRTARMDKFKSLNQTSKVVDADEAKNINNTDEGRWIVKSIEVHNITVKSDREEEDSKLHSFKEENSKDEANDKKPKASVTVGDVETSINEDFSLHI